MRALRILVVGLLFAVAAQLANGAPARQGMIVTGDRELPRILYVVPWKEAQPPPAGELRLADPWPRVFDQRAFARKLQRGAVDTAGSGGR